MTHRKYEVKCPAEKCDYYSYPMPKGLAERAAEMHEMLGPSHKCKLIPVKP